MVTRVTEYLRVECEYQTISSRVGVNIKINFEHFLHSQERFCRSLLVKSHSSQSIGSNIDYYSIEIWSKCWGAKFFYDDSFNSKISDSIWEVYHITRCRRLVTEVLFKMCIRYFPGQKRFIFVIFSTVSKNFEASRETSRTYLLLAWK